MSVLVIAKKTQGGLYDFSSDPNAGALGNSNLGVWLPANSVITGFITKTITTLTGGNNAAIAFNIGVPLQVATLIGAFTAGTVQEGLDFNANPSPLSAGTAPQVFMTITNAALTGGKIAFFIEYIEMTV